MRIKNLFQGPKTPLIPGALATAFAGEGVMLNLVELEAGTEVPAHAHPEEQLTLVLEGRLAFELEDEVRELAAGDALWVPGGARHRVVALEPTRVLDVFSPVRRDLLEKLA